MLLSACLCAVMVSATPLGADADRKAAYVEAVTRGEGLLPWQKPGPSEEEVAFRREIEARKDRLLAARMAVEHPVLLTDEHFACARRNMEAADWARAWSDQHQRLADYAIAQDDAWVEQMIPELTPTNSYGFTCPNCVGRESQEGVGKSLMSWDYRNPEICTCLECGHVYPSEKHPETARLVCPRSGQTFTYYLNDRERKNPADRSGKLAYHWVGRPIHVSFTGVIREAKVLFMASACRSLALTYRLSGDPRYADKAIAILVRLAHCYRHWLYHDYWDAIADCDPMYAAWHDRELPLEFKRHRCADAYAKDQPDRAAMLQNYWGCGRIHPSTDAISLAANLALAYDLVHDARDAAGRPLWSDADRALVERDLLLEYIMTAEPFVGGADQATNVNNKAPRVYRAMAVVAKCLGLAGMADTALRGYEAVRDQSFLYDGFTGESPAYTNMFMAELVLIPEELHGFRWPSGFPNREGTVDVYRTDERLRLMFRMLTDHVRPDGRYPPLSDTMVDAGPSTFLPEIGLHRYPEYYNGTLPALYRGGTPTEYALFRLGPDEADRDRGLNLPEICFPAWKTAILRHGRGPDASMLTLTFSPPGGHRHEDNLALFYADSGRTVLGDHGYVGDMPVNKWIHSTLSHNLVVVDGADQRRSPRRTRLHRFMMSPGVSVVEASSDAYEQCAEYRRLVALVKGPDTRTFAVDIFRVKGGQRHAYRLFSELASSDAADGRLEFTGVTLPLEPPLPKVGASLDPKDILGLRDVRGVEAPPEAWQAAWREQGGWYRAWIAAPAHRVEAANGPGQETRAQIGRRVRYVDVIRQGDDLESTFVAVHEPGGPDGSEIIRRVERLAVPPEAGPDAVAVRIESAWGEYLVLSDFAGTADVASVRFAGAFGIMNTPSDGRRWLLASEAGAFKAGDFGFAGASPAWMGRITKRSADEMEVDTPCPVDWPATPAGVDSYVLVGSGPEMTGLPVREVTERAIRVERFPLPDAAEFCLPNVRWIEE